MAIGGRLNVRVNVQYKSLSKKSTSAVDVFCECVHKEENNLLFCCTVIKNCYRYYQLCWLATINCQRSKYHFIHNNNQRLIKLLPTPQGMAHDNILIPTILLQKFAEEKYMTVISETEYKTTQAWILMQHFFVSAKCSTTATILSWFRIGWMKRLAKWFTRVY